MPVGVLKVNGEGGIREGTMGAQMFDAADSGKDWAERWVARVSEANDFSADSILLSSKSEGDKSSGVKCSIRVIKDIQIDTTRAKADIGEAKGGGGGQRGGVFARV